MKNIGDKILISAIVCVIWHAGYDPFIRLFRDWPMKTPQSFYTSLYLAWCMALTFEYGEKFLTSVRYNWGWWAIMAVAFAPIISAAK